MGQGNSDSKPAVINGLFTVLGAVLGALITGYFLLKSIDKSAEVQEIILATNTALVQEIQSGNSTQQSLFQTAAAPTSTALDPIIVTATLQPTARPTSTPILPSFSDDFESGISPDWNILYGNLGMANGKFTVTSPLEGRQDFHMALLDNYLWSNFKIEVILAEFDPYMMCFPCDVSAATGIIIRYNPEGPSIGLVLIAAKNQIAFAAFDNSGNWSIIETTKVGDSSLNTVNFGSHPNKIVIEARGDTYFASIDGKQLTSATISGLTNGQVGLWYSNSSNDDNLDAYAARYESFKINALP